MSDIEKWKNSGVKKFSVTKEEWEAVKGYAKKLYETKTNEKKLKRKITKEELNTTNKDVYVHDFLILQDDTKQEGYKIVALSREKSKDEGILYFEEGNIVKSFMDENGNLGVVKITDLDSASNREPKNPDIDYKDLGIKTVTLIDKQEGFFGIGSKTEKYTVYDIPQTETILSDYFKENPKLDFRTKIKIMLATIKAVTEIHEKGILLRNINANNLTISFDKNGNPQIKALDFGFAIKKDKLPQNSGYSEASDLFDLGDLFLGKGLLDIETMNLFEAILKAKELRTGSEKITSKEEPQGIDIDAVITRLTQMQDIVTKSSKLQEASSELKKNKTVVYAAVQNDPTALQYADKSLLEDQEFMKGCIKLYPNNKDFVKFIVKHCPFVPPDDSNILQFAAPSLLKDKAFMKDCIKLHPSNKDFVKFIVKHCPFVPPDDSNILQFAEPSLLTDKAFMKDCIKLHPSNKEFVKFIVEHCPFVPPDDSNILQFAAPSLLKDKAFMKDCIKLHPSNKDFVKFIVKHCPFVPPDDSNILQFAEPSLLTDKAFMKDCIKLHPSNKEFVKFIVEHCPFVPPDDSNILQFAEPSLLTDKAFMKDCIKLHPSNKDFVKFIVKHCPFVPLEDHSNLQVPTVLQYVNALQFADPSLLTDEEFMAECMELRPSTQGNNTVKERDNDNKESVKFVVQHCPDALKEYKPTWQDLSLLIDEQFMLECIKLNADTLKVVDKSLFNKKEFSSKCIKLHSENDDFVLSLFEKCPPAVIYDLIEQVGENLITNEKFLKRLISKIGPGPDLKSIKNILRKQKPGNRVKALESIYNALQEITSTTRIELSLIALYPDDADFVKYIVTNSSEEIGEKLSKIGSDLRVKSDFMKGLMDEQMQELDAQSSVVLSDKDKNKYKEILKAFIVNTFIGQDLVFIKDRIEKADLQKDEKFMNDIMKLRPYDKEFAKWVVGRCGLALQNVGKEFRSDIEIAKSAIKQNPEADQYVEGFFTKLELKERFLEKLRFIRDFVWENFKKLFSSEKETQKNKSNEQSEAPSITPAVPDPQINQPEQQTTQPPILPQFNNENKKNEKNTKKIQETNGSGDEKNLPPTLPDKDRKGPVRS